MEANSVEGAATHEAVGGESSPHGRHALPVVGAMISPAILTDYRLAWARKGKTGEAIDVLSKAGFILHPFLGVIEVGHPEWEEEVPLLRLTPKRGIEGRVYLRFWKNNKELEQRALDVVYGKGVVNWDAFEPSGTLRCVKLPLDLSATWKVHDEGG